MQLCILACLIMFMLFFGGFFGSLQINNINTHIISFLIASRIVKKSYYPWQAKKSLNENVIHWQLLRVYNAHIYLQQFLIFVTAKTTLSYRLNTAI